MIVDSLTHRPLVGLPPTSRVREASIRMKERDVGSVVVVGPGGKIWGIVTERDIVRRVVAEGLDPDSTPLKDVMSSPVATIESEAPLEEAVRMMKALKVKRLVVTRRGVPIGVVGVTDVAYSEVDAARRFFETWVRPRFED